MKVAYGIDVKTEDDPYVETAEQALQAIAACANPGSFLVDVLPIRERPLSFTSIPLRP